MRNGDEGKKGTGAAARGRPGGATAHVLQLLDEAFDHRAWHGPNLAGSIRGVDSAKAAWRPGPGRPSIDEIVLHCAYWKHRVLRRVAPASVQVGAFPRGGRNWFAAPAHLTSAAWRGDVALLKRTHAALLEAASALDDRALERPGTGQKRSRRHNLEGIAFHDVYHAGQIRLVRKLYERAKGRGAS